MEINFLEVLKSDEYKFLKEDKQLGQNIIILTLGGSYAYGTNVQTSDIDIRGCAVNSKSDILGFGSFEQFIDRKTDTTIYSFNKLITLLTNCNPNTIEILGSKKEHYFYVHPIGEELLHHKKMFLSKKAVNSFAGYANQQLRRLKNALATDSYTQSDKEKQIMDSCNSAIQGFKEKYTNFEQASIILNIKKSPNKNIDPEIFIDITLKDYPLQDYKNIISDLHKIIKNCGTLNTQKDDEHLNKHAMHLIRLYLMALDILEKEKIITYREHDINLLMDIRTGKYQKDDKSFIPEFFEMIDLYKKKLDYAIKNTSLSDTPNYEQIEDFVMSVNERVVRDEY